MVIEVLGLRYREAAAVLDIPEGTVKRRVFDARVRLHRWSAADTDAGATAGRDAGGATTASPVASPAGPGPTADSPATPTRRGRPAGASDQREDRPGEA